MTDPIDRLEKETDRRFARLEGDVRELGELRTDVQINNERQQHTLEAVGRLCKKVDEHVTADDARAEEFSRWAFKGTDTKDGAETRISRIEGFTGRAKKWAGWVLGIIGTLITGAIGYIATRGGGE